MVKEFDILKSKLAELEKENETLKNILFGKKNSIRESISKLLIVEGSHEKNFFEKWLESFKIDDIQIMDIGGKYILNNNLEDLVRQANFRNVISMLITRDADDNPSLAFASVKGALERVGLPCPESAWTFTKDTVPRVGIAILPGINRTGALEELLLQTIDNDPMSEKSHDFINDAIVTLSGPDNRPPPPEHRVGKAKVHAFLSTFEEPDKDQGKAALAGVWDFKHKALDPLRSILDEL